MSEPIADESQDADEVDRAQRQGREEAEAFEAALRRAEDRQRGERLEELAAQDGGDTGADAESAPTEIARLRSQVEDLASFRNAVLASKPWQAAELVRRLLGRSW